MSVYLVLLVMADWENVVIVVVHRCHSSRCTDRCRSHVVECSEPNQSQFLGRGCDEALFSEKGFFSENGGGKPVNEGFGKDSTRKAIQ